MNYGEFTIDVARYGYRNLIGIVVFSVLATLSLLPFVVSLFLGTTIAALGGLWATSLLSGVVTLGAFHFSTNVANRGVPVAVVPSLAFALRRTTAGFLLGVTFFVVIVSSVALVVLVSASIRPLAIGFAGFLVTAWFLLTAFGSPEFGTGTELSVALRSSFDRLGRTPARVVWFFTVSVVCTLLAGLTLITLFLILPGTLALFAAHAATETDPAGNGNRDS